MPALAVASVAGAGDDVVTLRLLHANHVGDELGVVREVGVHDDDEVARRELQSVDVGRPKAKFRSARPDLDAGGAVDLLELLGDFLRAIGGSVVDDD